MGPSSAPGCDEPTSRCQTSSSIWTLRGDQPVIPGVPFIRLAIALPFGTTGSLNPAFAPARPVCLTVRLPSAFMLYKAISIRLEETFEHLRYILGGDHPSQTTHQTLSFLRITDEKLDFQTREGGISRLTPSQLASRLQSLPPILHKPIQKSISSYSKGAQGLSVLPRVLGIFTETTNSLSLPSRQRPSRYAIHAGRNLPDKGLRYLRTVRVTAAVYWGFDSELRLTTNPSC